MWIRHLEDCEDPTGSTTIRVLDTNNKYSYGLLQFQMKTWLKQGNTRDTIYDPDLQEQTAQAMLDAGGWQNWFTCAQHVEQKYGPYPLAL